MTANEALLPQLVERPDHAAEGELGTPVAVDEPGPDDGDVGMLRERLQQSIDRLRRHDGVAVEQQQIGAAARANADVVPARKADVRSVLDHLHAGPSPCGIGAAVGRGIVDDDDFVRSARR